MLHAGPKSQFGGVKAGLFKWTYQVGMLGMVATVPIAAAHATTAPASRAAGSLFDRTGGVEVTSKLTFVVYDNDGNLVQRVRV